MAQQAMETDVEGDLVALSLAARWLLTRLDGELMAERAVESLADFGQSDRVGLFRFDEEGSLWAIAGYVAGVPRPCAFPLTLPPAWHEHLIAGRNLGSYPLGEVAGVPVPAETGAAAGLCLAAPLVATDNRVVGLATFAHPAGFALPPMRTQSLALLLTLTAVALETARLFRSVVTDGLTGLYVRRYLDHRLAEAEARLRRHGGRLALLMLDIDHFKRVNDTYGHPQGDAVLRAVAAAVRTAVRQEVDAPCRYGGEEFAVLMPDTGREGALAVAERIRRAVGALDFAAPAGPFRVTISGGVALLEGGGAFVRGDLLRRADEALYRAKRGGRDRICLWEAETGQGAPEDRPA